MVHLLLAATVVLPALALRLILRYGNRLPDDRLTLLLFLSGTLHLLPLAVALASDWVALIYTGANRLLGALLLLLPLVCSGLLTQRELHRLTLRSRPAQPFGAYLLQKLRVGLLRSIPLLLSLGLLAALTQFFPDLTLGRTALIGLFGMALLLTFSSYPYLFKVAMRGRRLTDPERRQALMNLALRAGVSVRDIIVIPAGHSKALNAWVAGIWPGCRIVFLTDALLTHLTVREVEAVFAHELGHIRKRHLWAYLAYAVTSTAVFTLTGPLWSGLLPDHPGLIPLKSGLTGLLIFLGFAALSRRFELGADRFSLMLTGDAGAVAGALEKLAARRQAPAPERGWMTLLRTHPPTSERIRHIQSWRPVR